MKTSKQNGSKYSTELISSQLTLECNTVTVIVRYLNLLYFRRIYWPYFAQFVFTRCEPAHSFLCDCY